MPKYIIGRSYGYVGTSDEDEFECDSLKEAEDAAQEWANENVDSWARLADGETEPQGETQ